MIRRALAALALCLCVPLISSAEAPPADVDVEHLAAFARLYGYARFFHPSHEASLVDWERFALHGAREVAAVQDRAELKATLERLFLPIAATLRIYPQGTQPPALPAPDTDGKVLVAWQHQGVGLAPGTPYRSVRVQREEVTGAGDRAPGRLSAARPQPGEEADRELGAGLRARFPLALWLDRQPTEEISPALASLLGELARVDLHATGGDDLEVRVAGVAIAWNVFQHFYPYFDVVDVDWNRVLTDRLADAVADRTEGDFLATLRRLTAALEDGHGYVFHPQIRSAVLGAELGWIEEQVVVLDPRTTRELEVGDVIRSVGGEAAASLLEARAAVFSGSERFRRHLALGEFAPGPEGTQIELELRRGGDLLTVEVPRKPRSFHRPESPPLQRLGEGIWRVDLRTDFAAEFRERIDELAAARGVVFDLRGYPSAALPEVLGHLSDEPLRPANMEIARTVYPDRTPPAEFFLPDGSRWMVQPREPRFRGRIVFLTNAAAISAAETYLGIVEHYRLGEIVGEATAGANGNVNPFSLPGGYRLLWTGMKVTKQDGSQHHLVGIHPTVPVSRTIEAVREGRDEVLERAIALIGD